MYTAVRHCQRNVDIDVEDGFNEPDRYDGTCIAELVNMLPSIIAALRQPQTDVDEDIRATALDFGNELLFAVIGLETEPHKTTAVFEVELRGRTRKVTVT
jgi:hypothetical protein